MAGVFIEVVGERVSPVINERKMKFLFKAKDGGEESKVTGYWLFESKRWGSVALLRFDKGSREAYHTHAFNAVSWVLRGQLREYVRRGVRMDMLPSFRPIYTPRNRFHKVVGIADTTWALSFRGPWLDKWKEFLPNTGENITLTHGRKQCK